MTASQAVCGTRLLRTVMPRSVAMTYVIGLFPDRPQAERALSRLRATGLSYAGETIKAYDPSPKGWTERIFGMVEPLSTLQAEGVEHEDARWYADRMEQGHVMVVLGTEGAAPSLARVLRDAGAEFVRLYSVESGRWVRTVFDEIGAPPPR
jgi:hypothetical protein